MIRAELKAAQTGLLLTNLNITMSVPLSAILKVSVRTNSSGSVAYYITVVFLNCIQSCKSRVRSIPAKSILTYSALHANFICNGGTVKDTAVQSAVLVMDCFGTTFTDEGTVMNVAQVIHICTS